MLRFPHPRTWLVVLPVLVGCTAGDVSGRWQETWSCEQTCEGMTETITGTVSMTLTQDGNDVTREDDDGTTWQGTLDGNVLTLTTSYEGYAEESVFTFLPDWDRFTVGSTYSTGVCAGTCAGDGQRL